MSDKYVLNGHLTAPCNDLMEWARWMEKADRTVAETKFRGGRVSTVFLGIDHNFFGGEPLLFETMIFGGKLDGEMERYSTWKEAEAGHKRICKRAEGKVPR